MKGDRQPFTHKPGNPFQPSPFEAARAVHDKAILIMDAKWGTDVLESLVSPETAARFASAKAKRDAAIEAGDDDAAIHAFGIVVRGLKAMDAEATAAGREPLKIDRSWPTRAEDGTPWVFVQSEEDARSAARSGRFKGYQIWSLPEVIRVLSQQSLVAVLDAKRVFPEASVTAVKEPVDWLDGDRIPF